MRKIFLLMVMAAGLLAAKVQAQVPVGSTLDCDITTLPYYENFDGFAEEVFRKELVECVVDFFFARDFETRGAICFEFFDCCHFSSFIFFLLKYTQKWGRRYKEL